MKLIRKKSDNTIYFKFPDSATVTIETDRVKVDNPDSGTPVMYIVNFPASDYDEVTGADEPTTWYPEGVLAHDGSAWSVANATRKATWDTYYADCKAYGDKLVAGTATESDVPVLGRIGA